MIILGDYLTVLMIAIRGFSDYHFKKLSLLTNNSKACFMSLILSMEMKGFSMGTTTAYTTEAVVSLSSVSHDEEKM